MENVKKEKLTAHLKLYPTLQVTNKLALRLIPSLSENLKSEGGGLRTTLTSAFDIFPSIPHYHNIREISPR